MSSYPTIILRKGKENAIKRFHPWIFSGAIYKKPKNLKDGVTVQVQDAYDHIIAIGHYHNGSISVRILAFEETEINAAFWNSKLKMAFQKREILDLSIENTNCFRLVHAEGDGLPGLIVDIYGEVAVMQCHSIGMHLDRENIAKAIIKNSNGLIKFVYDKSKEVLPKEYGINVENGYIGEAFTGNGLIVKENGHSFYVDWMQGQKTGFFLDQRVNRKLLGTYSKGKSVLNTFCYSGGFSIYALDNEAKEVHSVDVSQKAMDWTERNVALTSNNDNHTSHTDDVMSHLKDEKNNYDIVIVDPPAFAKSLRKKHNAVQGYKRLNALAFKRVNPGGMMFTFSCSQVIDEVLFKNTIVAAALEAERKVSILHRLSQPADHPVSLFHPEGSYLKGLVLYVE